MTRRRIGIYSNSVLLSDIVKAKPEIRSQHKIVVVTMTDAQSKDIRILIVDDETFVLNLSQKILRKLGYDSLTTASNGSEALEILNAANQTISLIICDLNMPEMDGVEFMRHAANARFEGGMILLSGEDERMLQTALDLAKAQNLNVLGAIPKPLRPDLLQPMLEAFKPSRSEKRQFTPQASLSPDELRAGLQSIDDTGLLLVFQPKVHVNTGKVSAVETLARWQHPERGILGPGAFIPLAEESGMINQLTEMIFRKAARQTADWLIDGLEIKTAVNFSVNSFTDADFPGFILNTVEEAGISPSTMTLEITETQVMDSVLDCMEAMMRMRMKRFGLSIDDFGTGNSSMAQLKTIPFTELKIDRAFVNNAANNKSARAILEASVSLAKSLEMETVAEGAETREDWDLVESLGIDFVQGYYCAKPMPNEEFLSFLEKWTGPH